MEMFSRKLRKYVAVLLAVVLMMCSGTPSAFAASVPGTEESSTEESRSKETSASVKSDAAETSASEESRISEESNTSEENNSAPVESSAAENKAAVEGSTSDESGVPGESSVPEESSTPDESSAPAGEDEAKALEVLEQTELKTEKESYTYNGASITPVVKLIYTNPSTNEEIDVTDYYIVAPVFDGDCVNAGTYGFSAVISGYYETGDDGQKTPVSFTGTSSEVKKEGSFTIEPMSLKDASLTLGATSVTYNGKERKPSTSVIVNLASGETKLSGGTAADKDYTTVYKDNKDAGTATVTVVGKNNFKDSAQATFTIKQASLSKVAALKLGVTSVTYNGKERKPSTSVTASLAAGDVKVDRSDYSVTYKNNKNAGTASVTVKAKSESNYTGSLTEKFTIKKKNITKGTASLSTTKYTYNGKDKKPTATVKIQLDKKSSVITLKKGTDYTVTYSSDCKSVGSKTVTIKGTGNYTGTVKKTYTIVPEKATGLKVSKRTTSSLTVTCNSAKNSGCKYHFMIKEYDSSKETWVELDSKKTTSNSATFSGLLAGHSYKFFVRIYKPTDSKTYIGAWSKSMKSVTSPAKPVVSSATMTGNKTMKVTWKAVNVATGYEIQYSTSSDFSSNTKTVTVTGRKTTSKSISLGTNNTYYARVRAYRTYEDKTYRGEWSSKVSTSWSNVYASYSTTYNSSNSNRSTNLRLACNAINGTILSDGGTFSFNGIVGERTAAKGYKEAIIYEGGQEVGGIGGGICQVATTLFNAALKANFQIVERHQHSLTVHYVPLGYDAAIAWGSKDFRFKNNSGTSVKVQTVASGGTLSVKFLTSTSKKPPAVTTKVTVRNGVYTLKRYVNGECNYTTTSDYLDD